MQNESKYMIKQLIKTPLFIISLMGGLGLWAVMHYSGGKDNHFLRTLTVKKQDAVNGSLKNKQNLVSIAVIGSGPAGMMAGVYGARALRDTIIFEGDKPGGLLMDTTDVENWPGENGINGPDIMAKLRLQAKRLGAYFVQETVDSIDLTQWPYKIITDTDTQIYALTVIVATGATPKRLGIPGENENWGSGVSACAVCDAPFFKGREVMVVGGGDSAVEEAIQLAPFVKKVTIMVRKDAMRAAASMQARIKNYSNIFITYNVELREIISDEKGSVTHALVYDNQRDLTNLVPIDGIFLAIGHSPNTAIFNGQLQMDTEGHIEVAGRSQKTSIDGVFAAGDVEDTVYRQAGVAAASGIRAALDADQFLSSIGVTKETMEQLGSRRFVDTISSVMRGIPSFTAIEEIREYSATKDTILFILFYNDTCNTSLQMFPIFEGFAQENEQFLFATVNTEQASSLVEQFFVNKVPCVFAFKNGELIGRCNGLLNKQQLTQFAQSFEI